MVAIGHDGNVFFARMLRCTITSMSRDAAPQRPRYRRAIRYVVDYVQPDEVIMETFVSRGFGTVLTEYVNIMLGGLMMVCDFRNVEEHAIMASTWKNSVGLWYRWPDFSPTGKPKTHGKQAMAHLYSRAQPLGVPNHLVDALLIGTYLRHGKSMQNVRWSKVHHNVRRIARLMPRQDRVPQRTAPKSKRSRA